LGVAKAAGVAAAGALRNLLRRAVIGSVAVVFAFGLLELPLRGAEAEERPLGVIDLHVDLPYRSFFKKQPFQTGLGEFSADRLKAAGVVGVVLPLYVPEWASPEGPRAVDLEDSYKAVFEGILDTPPYALPGCGVKQAGRSGARDVETWLAFEGAAPLEASDGASAERSVDEWMLRGVRSFGLVHSRHNSLASSSGQPLSAKQGGLTARGFELARAIQKRGGVIDVSHSSDATVDDVVRLAEASGSVVIATHSNARALANHPRNLSDKHLAAIARTGGIIGVNFHQGFLSATGTATLQNVVEQVRHMVRVAGVDHVALGSDYEGGIRPVPELRDASRYQVLARALEQSGLERAAVRKIFAENALRVLCTTKPRKP
jgi:membrane dipeptidase